MDDVMSIGLLFSNECAQKCFTGGHPSDRGHVSTFSMSSGTRSCPAIGQFTQHEAAFSQQGLPEPVLSHLTVG
jgi:hypothetical protein